MRALTSILAVVVAIVAGLGLAFIDSRPGFDDTGVTAVGLAIAGGIAVLIDGSGRLFRAALLAGLVGIWIPLLEIAPPGNTGPLLALVFSGAGAAVGALIVRAIARPSGRANSPS
jgi:hypothetical protein